MFFKSLPWPKNRHIHKVSKNIHELVDMLEKQDNGHFLYRGQNGLFGPGKHLTRQVPRCYRGCQSKSDSEAALKTCYSLVTWLFGSIVANPMLSGIVLPYISEPPEEKREDLNQVDFDIILAFALAQHYGIGTEFLDLTNLKPAAVFASNEWKSIAIASRFPAGHNFSVKNQKYGFIFRYYVPYLIEHVHRIVDLGTGRFGSRPLIQEGKVASIRFNQDIEMFENGVYDIFPFYHDSKPFKYSPPVTLSEETCKGLSSQSAYQLIAISELHWRN